MSDPSLPYFPPPLQSAIPIPTQPLQTTYWDMLNAPFQPPPPPPPPSPPSWLSYTPLGPLPPPLPPMPSYSPLTSVVSAQQPPQLPLPLPSSPPPFPSLEPLSDTEVSPFNTPVQTPVKQVTRVKLRECKMCGGFFKPHVDMAKHSAECAKIIMWKAKQREKEQRRKEQQGAPSQRPIHLFNYVYQDFNGKMIKVKQETLNRPSSEESW